MDGMSAFGLEASKATMFADTLAKASTSTNTDVAGLGEGFKYSAASAHSFGMEVHETAAALGTFANAGIKGSSGGTVLNAMLRDMKSKSKDGKIAIGQTAVAIYDAAGNARGFSDILADVEKATVGMTGAQKDAALAAIFGDEAMRGVNIALGEGSDKLKELEKDFKNSEGAAARMGEVMGDNLGGDLKGLASAWEGFKIALFDEGLGDFARPIIQGITGVIQTFPKGISKAGEFFRFIKSEPKKGAEALTEMGKNIEKFGAAYPILEKLQQGFSKIREKAVEMKDKVNGALTEMRSYIESKMIELAPVFERLGAVFREWGQLAMEVFAKLWGFVSPILSILGTALRILGDVAMTVFAAVIVPAIELMWSAMQNAWAIISPVLDGMKMALETTGQAMTWLWENAGLPLVTFLGGALKLGIDTAKAAVEAFSGAFEWLGDKISAVTGIFGDMKDKLMSFKPPEWVGNLGGKISGAVSSVSNFIAGSHATGLERVGYDGYVAELHKGESVLTASQSQALRNTGMLTANADGTPNLEIGEQRPTAPQQNHLDFNLTQFDIPELDLSGIEADIGRFASSQRDLATPEINESNITNNDTSNKTNNISNNFSITVNATATDAKPVDIGVAVRREIEKLISTTQAAMGTS